jgi:hypothetical protein
MLFQESNAHRQSQGSSPLAVPDVRRPRCTPSYRYGMARTFWSAEAKCSCTARMADGEASLLHGTYRTAAGSAQ